MRIIRFRSNPEAEPEWGWLKDDKIGRLHDTPFDAFKRDPAEIELSTVKLLAPVVPGKIVAVGRNYPEHAREHQAEIPSRPLLFLKPPSTIIGPDEPILLPPQSEQVEHEAELAVIVGYRAKWIQPSEAKAYILGYTIANDVTARDLQREDGQWTRGKSFDTFCPLGPWIDTELDPADALITCSVNQQMRQMGSTRDMVFTVNRLVAYISTIMTLEPGDLILTGTPAGVSPLLAGDTVSVEIEGLGKLSNPVHKAAPPRAEF